MAYDIGELFRAARENPRNPMNRAGRLTGKHCAARLQRAQARRAKRGKRPFHPGIVGRPVPEVSA